MEKSSFLLKGPISSEYINMNLYLLNIGKMNIEERREWGRLVILVWKLIDSKKANEQHISTLTSSWIRTQAPLRF